MGYCYFANGEKAGKLCCEGCSSGVGRKRACPYGWCQPAALCKECWKTGKAKFLAYHEKVGCKLAHEEFAAKQTLEAEMLAAGKWIRCAAMAVYFGAETKIQVLFKNGTGGTVGYFMSHETYEKIPLLVPTTPETYVEANGGPLEPAPPAFIYSGSTTKEAT